MAKYIISATVTDPQSGEEGRGGEQELQGAVQEGLRGLGVIVDDVSVRELGVRQQRAQEAQGRAFQREMQEAQGLAPGGGPDQGLQQLQQGLEQQYEQVQRQFGQGFGQRQAAVEERNLPVQGGLPPEYQVSPEAAGTADVPPRELGGGQRGRQVGPRQGAQG